MRLLAVVLIGVLALSAPGLAQNDFADLAQQATVAYEDGDYETAITQYIRLIDAGVNDAVVYFNLGNAYYQTGEVGRSLVNYRRAHRLIPRDSQLNENIARVRAQRVNLAGDETDPFNSLSEATAGSLTLRELAWIVLLLWGL